MKTKLYDWKDVANAQFSKALSLALVLLLFAMMVTPKIEVKRQKFTVQQMELVDIPMEERQKEEPPETDIKIDIPIVISDELGSSSEFDVKKYEQIVDQIGNIFSTSTANIGRDREELRVFVEYDDPPVMIGNLNPEYPAFARNAGLQGMVVLEVEVYRDGTIGDIRVRRSLQAGPGGLDEAAIRAVRRVRFQPGRSSGQPVDTMVIIPIEFKLN
ncbi:MAG: TonB family protein [Candidatus Cloacimonadaceae bacterium]|nr:TonB family protein [Candidatus Cloacimonadaceae bacterium]